MGYGTYLVELLRPLGVYDLSRGTVNRGELDGYGAALDAGQFVDIINAANQD